MSRAEHFPLAEVEQTIPARFASQLATHRSRIAIRTPEASLTYGQLDARSDLIASQLIDLGVNRGDRVALLFEQGPALVAAIIGALKSGAIYVPIDPRWARARAARVIENADASVILADEFNGLLGELLNRRLNRLLEIARAETSDELRHSSAVRARIEELAPDDPVYIYYTSGSTGAPKGVVDCHRNVLHNVRRYTNNLSIGPHDRITLLQSCGFSGAVSNLFCALLNGARLLVGDIRRVGAAEMAAWLASEGATIYHSVPSVFRAIAGSGIELPNLRIIRLEGDAATSSDVQLYRSHFSAGCTLVHGLGATETGIVAQHFIAHDGAQSHGSVPVGSPCAEVSVSVMDSDGRPCRPLELGEVCVSSPYLAIGYWRRPDLNERAFMVHADGSRTYRTGDLGLIRADGMLELHGRLDARTGIKGSWVELESIELELAEQPGVRSVVVCISVDAAQPPRFTAYVVPDGTIEESVLRLRLVESCHEARAHGADIAIVDALPLDENGKVDRKALTLKASRDAENAASVAARDIAEVFARVLRLPYVNVGSNFFELGGDSLHAAEATLALARRFDQDFVVGAFQHAPTAASLAEILLGAGAAGTLVPLQPDGPRQPFFCVHGHKGHAFHLRALADRFAPDRPFLGIQARGLRGPRHAHFTVGDMAGHYIEEMRAHGAEPPYAIGGHCFGSTVALEMACQLERAGLGVGFLALIDPDPLQGMSPPATCSRWARSVSEALQSGPRELLRRVLARLFQCTRRMKARLLLTVWRLGLAGRAPMSRMYRRIDNSIATADTSYRPGTYHGDVWIFLPADRLASWVERAWRRLLPGRVTFVTLSGTSANLMREPSVRQLGDALLLQMQEAFRENRRAGVSTHSEAPGPYESTVQS